MNPGPYAEAAQTYWHAGWRGIIPVPARTKRLRLTGWTGEKGTWPSYADIYDWSTNPATGDGNIALRLPHHILGIDVDDYDGKGGGATLQTLIERFGPLPATWRSTSRDDGTSGILFFIVPEGLAWPANITPGIEIIQYRHRYAVVWPSVHPEGRTYRWITPGGATSTVIPAVDELPELPDTWIVGLTGGEMATPTNKATITLHRSQKWLLDAPQGPRCPRMTKATTNALHALAETGSRHDTTMSHQLRLVRYAEQGHHGVLDAITQLHAQFITEATKTGSGQRSGIEAEAEWSRGLTGAVATVIGNPGARHEPDNCCGPTDDDDLIALVAPVTPTLDTDTHGAPETGEQEPDEQPPPALQFLTFAELAAKVDAAGPRRWLLRGVWPAGDYGVHAAEAKAQKTWNTSDLAVSVASGTPWLGSVPVENPGPVLMFIGEGGEANTVRRIRATAEARDTTAETLPIVVCTRAPHLSNRNHLELLAEQIRSQRPVLVTLDPLYLAARGANLADLYAMGELLETVQRICQAAEASLFVVHHFNRKEGRGAARMTGAGPAEWGRVLIASTVKSRRTDPATGATDVITELDIIGGEIPDQTIRLHRKIWSDDPDDLDSPLHLNTQAMMVNTDDPEQLPGSPEVAISPAGQKLYEALQAAVVPQTGRQLVDLIAAKHGHGLRRETVSREMNALAKAGLVVGSEDGPPGSFVIKTWTLVDHGDDVENGVSPVRTRDGHTDHETKDDDLVNMQVAPCDPCDLTCDQSRVTGVTAPIGRGGHTSHDGAAMRANPPLDERAVTALTPDPVPVGDLATQLGVDVWDLDLALDRLIQRGLVIRHAPTTGPPTFSLPPEPAA